MAQSNYELSAVIVRLKMTRWTCWPPYPCLVQRHFRDLQKDPSLGYAQEAGSRGACSSLPRSSRVRPYSVSGSNEEQARLSNLSLQELVAMEQASELQAEQQRQHS
jgi:hypothetical protein